MADWITLLSWSFGIRVKGLLETQKTLKKCPSELQNTKSCKYRRIWTTKDKWRLQFITTLWYRKGKTLTDDVYYCMDTLQVTSENYSYWCIFCFRNQICQDCLKNLLKYHPVKQLKIRVHINDVPLYYDNGSKVHASIIPWNQQTTALVTWEVISRSIIWWSGDLHQCGHTLSRLRLDINLVLWTWP